MRFPPDVPDVTAIDVVERRAAEQPDRIAVIAVDGRVSYGELNERANSLAHRLVASGVGRESLVGVQLPRSADLVVALLGIHKAGAAYLPLSSTLPPARLAYMLEDSGAQHIVASGGATFFGVNVTGVEVRAQTSLEQREAAPAGARAPEQLAYVIYTSGSTGKSKGVQIEQGSLLRLLGAMGDVLGITSEDVALAISTVSFDIAAVELLLPLMRGATVAVASEAVARDPGLLARALDDVGATVMQATPATWRMLIDHGWTGRPGLRMLSGGETLSRNLADELLRRGAVLWNGYGPTEATIYASVGEVYPDGETVTIGTALDGVELAILDEEQRPVCPGASGELYIGGGCLARSYLNRPALTSERFVRPAALAGRWYRTGDVCRRLADGRLVFKGRLDHQVKVRGHRIELGEVESALGRVQAVRQAIVLARGEEASRRLVAFVATARDSRSDAAAIRDALRAELPDYMIPSTFFLMNTLPTTPNGKVDRVALAKIEEPQEEEEPRDPPETATQHRLERIWRDVLGCGPVGVNADYFDLGGQSLQAAVLMARIEDAFDVDLPLATIFAAPTIARLAEVVDRSPRDQPSLRMPSVSRDGGIPLSFAQRRLWYLERYEEIGAAYNEPYATDLHGPLDLGRLRNALEVVVGRHEALRTTIADTEAEPTQAAQPNPAFEWSVIDLASSPPSPRALDERLRAEARRPFHLDRGPIVRGCAVVLSPDRSVFLLVVHHISCDDWSMRLIFREIAAAYTLGADAESEIGEAPLLHYGDFSSWQRRRVSGAKLERQLRYWADRLRDVQTSPPLLADYARPAVLTHGGGRISLQIARPEADLLDRYCRERGHSAFPALLAAYGALLARYAGRDDLVIGTPVTQRRGAASQRMVGFMLNTLPIRVDVSGNPSFHDLVSRVHAEVLRAMDHQDAPFEQIVERVNPARGRSHAPLFQLAFTWLEEDLPALKLPACSSSARPVHTETAKYDLTLELWRSEGGLRGHIEFASELFHVATAANFAEHYKRFLSGALAAPSAPISDIDVLTSEERAAVIDVLNAEPRPYSRDGTLDQLFREQVEFNPGSPALVEGDRVLDYASLDGEAERLAQVLRERQIQPGARVAIDIPRSIDFVVAVLAVLRIGATYVPLDPAAPAVRRRHLLESVNCRAVIVGSERPVLQGSDVPCIDVDAFPTRTNRPSPVPAVSAEDEAYVMFTSGTAGTPKAVAVPHRAVVRLVQAQDYLPFDQHQTLLLHSNTGFDAATFELWGALLHGARLAIAPGVTCDMRELGALIRRHEVTCLWLTSSLFCAMIDDMPGALRGLAWIITGGEALSVAHVQRGLHELPATTIVNGYGPTEAVTFACTYRIPRGLDPKAHSVPIGRPLANTRAYVLDDHQRPAAFGVPGELYIGGDAVALGYTNDRELTLRRFLPDPFDPTPGARMYRTGDLCRLLRSGVIEFLGRIDDQVKVRGFRIEPGEIRTVLSGHESVRQAVIVTTGEPRDRRLIAYVTALPPEPTASELRDYLLERLPSYMVPTEFVFLEGMPLTRNGKVDLAKLPSCTTPRRARAEACAFVPGDEVERRTLSVWRELLAPEAVGLDDDFFSLGGHSLLAARLVARLSRDFDVSLSINEFLQYPTVRLLAARLRTPPATATYMAVPIQPAGERPPLFFLPGLGGSAFVLPDLSRHIGPDQPIYALEAQGGDHPPDIEELSAACVAGIRAVRPIGPYHLAGFSLGGTLAYESAQQLLAAGQEVRLLAIIDHAPANLKWDIAAVMHAFANVPFWLAQLVRHPPKRPMASLRALVLRFRGKRVRVDDVVDLSEWPEGMRSIASAQYDAYRAYVPQPYAGGIFLVRARRQPLLDPMSRENGWGRLARDGVEVLTIPGGHLSVFEGRGLALLGRRLKELLDASSTQSQGVER